MFEISQIREQFPALHQKIRNQKELIYLDSAATTLKPRSVIDRISQFNSYETANVHRGAHFLSDQATENFEKARQSIQKFIGAEFDEEIIFTKGTTESLNLVATSYGETFLSEGDEIVITELEHHANIIPWQNLALKKKLVLKYIPVISNGEIDETEIATVITSKTKLVSFSGCSNILGTLLPIEKIVKRAKEVGAVTVLDAAQLISQKKINAQKLGIDFIAFSAHKLFGPYGFGVLYGRKKLLDQMPPYQFGGSMIKEVQFTQTTYNGLPFKFEAGTPHIEGALGTHAAIDFVNQLDMTEIFKHEQNLLNLATEKLLAIPKLKIFGAAQDKAAIISFNIDGIHHSDLGQLLDQMGIAVRVGHHCTQPLLKKFGLTGTVRATISIYNNENDINTFIQGVQKAQELLS